MALTIPILSALLLSLILGSTEGGQRTDPVSLLRQTIRYWQKIYKTYNDEMTLGYCLVDYLLEISNESSTNLSASLPAATRDSPDTIVGATKSQQNPFSRNVVEDAATPFKETGKEKHPREKRWSHVTARSTISKFVNHPDEYRVTSRSKMIQKGRKQITNKIEQASQTVSNNYTRRNSKINKNGRNARMIDSYMQKRLRALSMVPELLRDEREAARGDHEFSSSGTSSHAFNPTPNPRDDNKVGSTDLREENSRRKVLRSLTSHRHSFASRSFKVAREGSLSDQQFPFRQYSSLQKRRVDETLSDPWMPQKDRRIEADSVASISHRASLNNDGSSSTPSRSQFRRINADAKRSHVSAVKLMDSEENSSYDSTINSKTPHRKPEELFRDSLLSPRGRSAIAKRSLFEFRGSRGEVLNRDALLRFKMIRKSNAKKRHCQQSKEKESSRNRRDVSAIPLSDTFFSKFKRSYQQMLGEDHQFPPIPEILQKLNQLTQHSKLNASQISQSRDQTQLFVHYFQPSILRIFIQLGRQIIDVPNSAFACVREYLLTKIIKWIKS